MSGSLANFSYLDTYSLNWRQLHIKRYEQPVARVVHSRGGGRQWLKITSLFLPYLHSCKVSGRLPEVLNYPLILHGGLETVRMLGTCLTRRRLYPGLLEGFVLFTMASPAILRNPIVST